MPLELPGFYFDVERNRYFPVGTIPSNPTARPTTTATTVATKESTAPSAPKASDDQPQKSVSRRHSSIRREMDACLDSNERRQGLHELKMSGIGNMSFKSQTVAPFDHYGIDLTALAVSSNTIFAGDKAGLLYIAPTEEPDIPWVPHHHLGSQISSVHIHNETMYAASLGPRPQIFISNRDYMSSLSMHSFHDMWTVHWLPADPSASHSGVIDHPDSSSTVSALSAVIGMKQRAVYMPSLETHRGSYIMPTNSDVFAVYKHRSQVLTGARNGSIKLFDIRTPPSTHFTIFQPCVRSSRSTAGWDAMPGPSSSTSRLDVPSNPIGNRVPFTRSTSPSRITRIGVSTSPSRQATSLAPSPAPTYGFSSSKSNQNLRGASEGHTSSVTNLHIVNEWGLVVAAMDGTIFIYDLRFCGSSPSSGSRSGPTGPNAVMKLSGHVNSCTQSLGFFINSSCTFLFAAGEDAQIRAWSLQTGERITPPAKDGSTRPPGSRTDQSGSKQATGVKDKGSLLRRVFSKPPTAIVASEHNNEIWVASGRDVLSFKSGWTLD
ncbi:hypothetical protein CPB86DRAFT_815636 [Serendipita vermifera]|nr:hypothetical protein CPB86DRAFT_815636 [Serendipita vermifera]